MRTLIVADIHQAQNIQQVEDAISREQPDVVVFLGDYFDQWDDTPDDAERTAVWLKRSLKQGNRVHLWGNHDLPYAFPENSTCSYWAGFTEDKNRAIANVLTAEDWSRLVLSFRPEPHFLLTHAGLTAQHIPTGVADPFCWLAEQEQIAWNAFHSQSEHWIWGVGRSRGGPAPVGGLLWCDVDEFEPIPAVNQIFGHTPERYGVFKPGINCRNWCIDTADRQGIRHYVLLENGEAQVYRIDRSNEPAWSGKS